MEPDEAAAAERARKILESLQFSREHYVENVENMQQGPFAPSVMQKYDKRFDGQLEVRVLGWVRRCDALASLSNSCTSTGQVSDTFPDCVLYSLAQLEAAGLAVDAPLPFLLITLCCFVSQQRQKERRRRRTTKRHRVVRKDLLR